MPAPSVRLYPTLLDTMDCSPSGSSVHGILQARTLEWVAMPSSRGSFWPRNWTHVSCLSWIAGGFFIHWAIWEDQRVQMPKQKKKISLDLSETQLNNYILKYFLKCSVAIESEPRFSLSRIHRMSLGQIEKAALTYLHWQVGSLPLAPSGKPKCSFT